MLILGTLIMSVQYPILAEVHGLGLALAVLCLIASLGDVFYWVSFHAYFASLGDSEHRGSQISVRETVAALASVIAPLLGAWGIITVGGFWTFTLVGLVQAMAALPLINAPDVPVRQSVTGVFKAARPAVILLISDGWNCACFWLVWQIALFMTLKQNISSFGGAMALAGVVGAVMGLFMGRQIDAGHGRKAVGLALGIEAVIVALRTMSLHSSWLADFANAAGSVVIPLLASVIGTVLYNLSKGSPCAFRFIVATEAGWDIGCFMACVIGAIVYGFGLPLSYVLLMTLPGIAVQAVLFMGHYPQVSERKVPLAVPT